ncbi:MAG: anhydro-N-acetylmuramic acid kinase [Myxococcaceae bacterium]
MAKRLTSSGRICVGVLSGTSLDAVEAAVCHIQGTGARLKLSLLGHVSVPFPSALAEEVRRANSAQALCTLSFEMGEWFAQAALAALHACGVRPTDVDAIGSHGQTVAHLPPPHEPPGTLQLGAPAIIAERTGIPTVFDFRSADIAVGGQGAPLAPYLDWAAFRKPKRWRAFLNLGGIANLSVVGDVLSKTLAFDTGPANLLMDAIARRATRGTLRCDLDGQLSRQGVIIPSLLAELLRHPFFERPPPKSAGWEEFGERLATSLWQRFEKTPFDLIATLLELTVESIGRAFDTHVLHGRVLEGIYVSGGGTRHAGLMRALVQRLAPTPVHPLDVLGFPERAKEAALFALLASEHLAGTPANVPSATGARASVILGARTP